MEEMAKMVTPIFHTKAFRPSGAGLASPVACRLFPMLILLRQRSEAEMHRVRGRGAGGGEEDRRVGRGFGLGAMRASCATTKASEHTRQKRRAREECRGRPWSCHPRLRGGRLPTSN